MAVAFLCLGLAQSVSAQSDAALIAGTLHSYSTMSAIGLEWDVTGDADHDAHATTRYRRRGATSWRQGPDLLRVDFNGSNMLAGSLLFLSPRTEYEVSVTLADPDGGGTSRTVVVSTRPVPVPPTGGRTWHVVPGSGGGDGSALAPFRGIAAAEAAALPGDTFLLHAGSYGGRVRLSRAGTAGRHVVWKAAGDGEVAINGVDVAASWVWLEGVTVAGQTYGLLTVGAPSNVVVTRATFRGNRDAIYLNQGGSDWYIADNVIVGITDPASGSFTGEGIDLNTTHGHTVAHNSITRVADGISEPGYNVDIVGNDVFDTSDDGIEADFGAANVRMLGNRVHNAVHNAISFQPQSSAPWYIVRNQIVGSVEAALKFRTTDRFVLAHNTIVHWGNAWPGSSMMCCNEGQLLRAFARNNLWISVQGGQIWGFDAFVADWRSDLDFDGFDWGAAADPFTYGGVTYPDVWSFAAASGLQTNGVRVSKDECFADFRVPGPSPASVPPQVMALRAGCNAIDAGAAVPGLNDGFAGAAPDMGAHEFGHTDAAYGPRAPAALALSPTSIGFGGVTVGTAAASRRVVASNGGGAPLAIAGVALGGSHPAEFRVVIDTCSGQTLGAGGTCHVDVAFAPRSEGRFHAVLTFASNAAGDPREVTLSGDGVAADTGAPPAPWTSRDVGSVGVAGSATHSGGVYTVRGSGVDIWGTADGFHLVSQSLTGDGTVTARVTRLDGIDPWVKAGVMIRAAATAGAQHASMFVTTGKGLAFQRRRSAGGTSVHTGSAGSAPRWVRLQRAGSVLIAFTSTTGTTWTEVGRDTITMPATVLVGLAVTSHDNTRLATATFDNVAVAAAPPPRPPLPDGWQSRDIGSVGRAGSAVESGGTFTVKGAGADIWGTADAFHFAWRSVTGDATIVARVASLTGTHEWTKVGVMFRASTTTGAPHATMLVSRTRGLAFQRRRTENATSLHTSGGAGAAPRWVRVQRRGNVFIAAVSTDGVAWTEVGRDTIVMPPSVLVGLAVTSHSTTALATGVYDNVAVTVP